MVDVKLKLIGIIVIVLVSVIALGCVEAPSTQITQPKVQYKDSSNFLLSLTDLPSKENWTIMERGERNVNDVSSDALEYNWSGGYYIQFKSSDKDEVNYLKQYLSIYPEEKILGIFNEGAQDLEPLSNPSIGEHSKAGKFRNYIFGTEVVTYEIIFVKNNVLVTLQTWGVNTDYLKLKELDQKAFNKIDGY
ncbi:MAG: hypothetical protein Q7U60_00925, partial [Candidatus Methanoperedens sp.]|nr:hypothetical protein [Candidatus Methanoperedens sp.]